MTRPPRPVTETTVLVIEDELRLSDVLVSSANACGFRAEAVHTAEDAVQRMAARPCEIVMLDLNLPRMDGLQCFEIVRERWPGTAVVILTGFGTLQAAQCAIRLGVVEFLTKPASLGDIERALHRAWRARAADQREHEPADPQLPGAGRPADDVDAALPRTMSEIERDSIVRALDRHDGNRAAAAAELGISIRTLYYRLARYRTD